ncbi:hypothetical protein IEQ34_015230 [Dendrobium chrysotoxum]|uniref:Uncharacterized protein n=1 Tax=Dendrobium chrysotoxum TaxID=161865 RepID=A0AAV7GHU7_DENCH|nr:hypothetical protein IEQ34_015230 [Dendrobium chrysotoxum]
MPLNFSSRNYCSPASRAVIDIDAASGVCGTTIYDLNATADLLRGTPTDSFNSVQHRPTPSSLAELKGKLNNKFPSRKLKMFLLTKVDVHNPRMTHSVANESINTESARY